jgi:hypothetical protein
MKFSENNMKFILAIFFLVAWSPSFALPTRLDPSLEKEIIAELQNLGPDSWEEAGKQIQFTEIFFDPAHNQIVINYKSRLSQQKNIQKRTLIISAIQSPSDILEKASNGSQYLNPKITDIIFDGL